MRCYIYMFYIHAVLCFPYCTTYLLRPPSALMNYVSQLEVVFVVCLSPVLFPQMLVRRENLSTLVLQVSLICKAS